MPSQSDVYINFFAIDHRTPPCAIQENAPVGTKNGRNVGTTKGLRAGEQAECERAQHEHRAGLYIGYPCSAREVFAKSKNREW